MHYFDSNRIFESVSGGTVGRGKNHLFSNDLYVKAQTFATESEIFQNFTLQDIKNWIDNAAIWKAPKDLEQAFPYYLAGYDDEGLPIWIFESGKYNLRRTVQQGKGQLERLEKYIHQGLIHFLQSMLESERKNVSEIVVILDNDGLDISQVTHLPTVTYGLKLMQRYLNFYKVGLRKAILINVHFAAEVAVSYARPFLGELLERIEIHGGNRVKWISILRREFPHEVLPPWYGGSKNFKPVNVFG